jgi:hypothetical protein
MSLNPSGLILYGSVNMPVADGLTTGGAITGNIRVMFDDAIKANTPSGYLRVKSSTAGDNCQVWVYGRDSTGLPATDFMTVNGTTLASGNPPFAYTGDINSRILKIAATGTGFHNYTLSFLDQRGETLTTMESGVHTIVRPFYSISAEALGGADKTFYEKIFLKNNDTLYNGANACALLGGMVHETDNPGTDITFALATAQNDNETVVSRLNTAPTAVSAFNSLGKNIPNTDLGVGSGVGIWMKLLLVDGAVATKTTYTLQASGSST